jgi:hypothetical protein
MIERKRYHAVWLVGHGIVLVHGLSNRFRRICHAVSRCRTTGHCFRLVVLNPYIAGGILVDYLVWGRYNLIPRELTTVDALRLDPLKGPNGAEHPSAQGNGALMYDYP